MRHRGLQRRRSSADHQRQRALVDGTGGTNPAPDTERQILQLLHEKNLEEIAAGRTAMAGGTSEGVRAFGEQLVDHHTQNDADLRALTDALGVTLEEPNEESTTAQTLALLRGAELDARFAALMLEGHRSLVEQVERALPEVQNEQVRSFLADTLPVLRRHLQVAQELRGQGGHGTGSEAREPDDPF